MNQKELDDLSINTLRFLSIDQVEMARSGHPGLPMGAAPMAYTLWTRFLRFNPKNPEWSNRDRFVLSAGHGSALLYSLLHLCGYDLSLEDLKRFRQWGSQTPGHPEYGLTPGVEATTGPLGQGFANAVGMAIAESALASRYNQDDHKIIDHYTYAIVSDGDLMEGIASEAASLAGHLKLGKLIILYDNNHITIEGHTQLTFSEDIKARFEAYGWHTIKVRDGNSVNAIDVAIKEAKKQINRPSLIDIHTLIGYGSPGKQDTAGAHSDPLGLEELKATRENLHWPYTESFHIPKEVLAHFRKAVLKGEKWEKDWNERFKEYTEVHTSKANAFKRVMNNIPFQISGIDVPDFTLDQGPMATRKASGIILNIIGPRIPELIGGSADLAPSTYTTINSLENFDSGNGNGSNMHFGIREHAMGGVLNGMALHKGLLPYGGTFLTFSDYMRPPMRLAAMNKLRVIYVFTHDSIALGEDGPTHQPVEQLLGLRSIPGMTVIRPADANETIQAWHIAIEKRKGPVALVLSRQELPILDLNIYPNVKDGVVRGAYQLCPDTNLLAPDIILVATGSEVSLAVQAKEELAKENIKARVVSMPSWNLFQEQEEGYKTQLFPDNVPILGIEAGLSLGWVPYVGKAIDTISVDRYGASAPGATVMKEFGFTVDEVVSKAKKILNIKLNKIV